MSNDNCDNNPNPCNICGSLPKPTRHLFMDGYWLECQKCGILSSLMPSKTLEEATKLWNESHDPHNNIPE